MDHPLQTAALAAAPSEQIDREYALREGEHVPDAIRRVARGQLQSAHEQLADATASTLPEAVHETRKGLKRLRTGMRLTREAIGKQTYLEENAAYREAGGRLAAGRDAQVLLETLDALRWRFPAELPTPATATLRSQLEADRERAAAAAREDEAGVVAVLADLEAAIARTPAWTFEREGFDALAPGLRRIYRRGRKRMRIACEDPGADNLHEWRKRVKDLWHAAQLVGAARPKRLDRVSRHAHDVADLLGDNHDLSVLREYVEAHPRCFCDEGAMEALLEVIDHRAGALRDEALSSGRRLYEPSPKRFVGAIERGWSKRMGA